MLRAGLGSRPALTRQRVARVLDRPQARVRRIERQAVRRLRAASRTGACSAPGSAAVTSAGTGSPGGSLPAGQGASVPAVGELARDERAAREEVARGGVRGEREEKRERSIFGSGLPPTREVVGLTVPLLIVALLTAGWFILARVRRRRSGATTA